MNIRGRKTLLSAEQRWCDMNKAEAFKIVLNELKKCPLYIGHYDARHGDPQFMYGISTVMEAIAIRISDKEYDSITNEFMKNLVESQNKARKR